MCCLNVFFKWKEKTKFHLRFLLETVYGDISRQGTLLVTVYGDISRQGTLLVTVW